MARGNIFPVRASSPIQAAVENRFGSLAVRVDGTRFLVIDRPGCYDLSSFRLRGEALFVFNHRIGKDDTNTAPAYVGFQVVRTPPQIDKSYVAVFRNKSTDQESFWLLPKSAAPWTGLPIGAPVLPGNAASMSAEYKGETADADGASLLGKLNTQDFGQFKTTFGDWHALVAEAAEPASGWTVTANTALAQRSWHLPATGLKSMVGDRRFVVRNYLLKYRASAKPAKAVTFDVGISGVDCLYIKPVGHADELARMHVAGPLILQLKRDAVCVEGDAAFPPN